MLRRGRARTSSLLALAVLAAPLGDREGLGFPGPSPDGEAFSAAIAQGDERYRARDSGAREGRALPSPVEGAIESYRLALSLHPDSTEARAKLLRALFFRASFCDAGLEERRRRFQEALAVGEEGVARLGKAVAGREGQERLAALRAIPGASRVLLWAAVAWGEWALVQSRLTAARAGAPGRV